MPLQMEPILHNIRCRFTLGTSAASAEVLLSALLLEHVAAAEVLLSALLLEHVAARRIFSAGSAAMSGPGNKSPRD